MSIEKLKLGGLILILLVILALVITPIMHVCFVNHLFPNANIVVGILTAWWFVVGLVTLIFGWQHPSIYVKAYTVFYFFWIFICYFIWDAPGLDSPHFEMAVYNTELASPAVLAPLILLWYFMYKGDWNKWLSNYRARANRRASSVLTSIGVSIFVIGVLVLAIHSPFYFGTVRGDYDLEGDGVLELSWYLDKGDRTEGDFSVTGGNRKVLFYILNPSGNYAGGYWGYTPRNVTYDVCSYTTGQAGVFTLHFENLEPIDKVIHLDIQSPYHKPRIPVPFVVGGSMVFGGLVILVYALVIHVLPVISKRR